MSSARKRRFSAQSAILAWGVFLRVLLVGSTCTTSDAALAAPASRQRSSTIALLAFADEDRKLISFDDNRNELREYSFQKRRFRRLVVWRKYAPMINARGTVSPDGKNFFLCTIQTCQLVNLQTGAVQSVLQRWPGRAHSCFYDRKGRPVAIIGPHTGMARFYPEVIDVLTGRVLASPTRYSLSFAPTNRPFNVWGFALNAGITQIATSYSNGVFVVYSIKSGRVKATIRKPRSMRFSSACFSFLPGDRLAGVDVSVGFVVLSAKTGRTLATVAAPRRGSQLEGACGIFPDRRLAAVYAGGTLILVDTRTVHEKRRIRLGKAYLTASAISKNGRKLAVGSSDGHIWIVDLRTYRVTKIQ